MEFGIFEHDLDLAAISLFFILIILNGILDLLNK
jgi:hypothetical protein